MPDGANGGQYCHPERVRAENGSSSAISCHQSDAITGQFLLAADARNDCDRRAQYFKLVVCIDRVHFGAGVPVSFWRISCDTPPFVSAELKLCRKE